MKQVFLGLLRVAFPVVLMHAGIEIVGRIAPDPISYWLFCAVIIIVGTGCAIRTMHTVALELRNPQTPEE